MYEILDALILDRIAFLGKAKLINITYHQPIADEVNRLKDATGRVGFRILDGRLQALRKANKLVYVNQSWMIKV